MKAAIMLTISRLGHRSIKYYNDTADQATHAATKRQTPGGGLAEYYSEGETRVPSWLVVGDKRAISNATGLDASALEGGDADTDIAREWLDDGRTPNGACGREFTQKSVHGFDLTFSAPKSVSLIRALTDDVAEKVLATAHTQAVAAAMDYLHRRAGYTRVHNAITGNKDLQRLPGLVAIAYQHETSRCGDAGTMPGWFPRPAYTYTTLAQAKREYARIMTEAAAGTLVRRDKLTLGAFLTEWLDSRHVRPNTLDGYRAALKPIIDHLGTVPLQHLDTTHLDELVTLRLTGAPIAQCAKRGRRSAEVLAYLRTCPEGACYSQLLNKFGEPGIKALDRLVSSGDVLRPQRGRYVAARAIEPARPKVSGGVSDRTVCAMLTVLSSALTTAMKRGLVARNVAQLVDRPAIAYREMSTWTPQQAERFREHVRGDRLYPCWLLTLAGWRCSEVLGLLWSAVDFDAGTVSVTRVRVVVRRSGTATGAPKSARSRRTLPMPSDVMLALRALHAQQKRERVAFGPAWIDTGLIAVNEDGSPIRPETYSKAFRRHCTAAGVPVIRLHDTRHTAATRMLDIGTPVSATAKWLGHDPAMTLRVYGHVYEDALASAGDLLRGGTPSVDRQS